MLTKKFIPSLFFALLSSVLVISGCSQTTVTKSAQKTIEVPLIPLENFFDEKRIGQISLSPDGKWIAFFKEFNGAQNIFLVEQSKGIDEAVAITQSKDPIKRFQWSKNGNKLFFVKDEGGTENYQIYQLSFAAENLQQSISTKALTNNPEVQYHLAEQVKDVPTRLVIMSNHDNAGQQDVYHLDTITGALKRVAENRLGFNQFKLNRKGYPVIAISSNADNTNSVYINKNNQWRAVFTTEFGESIDLLNLDEEHHQVYLKANIQGRDKQELLRLDLSTNVFTTIHKDPKNQSDVYDVQFNDNNKPIAVSYYYGHLRTYPLNDTFAQHWQKITQQFGKNVEVTIKSIDEDTQQWQLHVASDVIAGSDHRYDANTNEFQVLLPQAQAISPKLLAKRLSITYQARDGVQIQGYLTLPNGQSKNLPTIILPHGGPWGRDYWTLNSGYFHSIAQLLANRGYAVLQPNFRASTGFGKRFINLGNKNWGTGAMQHDLTDGVNYLVKQGIADKARVGIMGASYGGYAALSGITFTPDVYKAAVSYVGPSSLITLMESFPAYLRPYLGQWYSAVGDPSIAADRVEMMARSPINFVDDIKSPLLLVQGANDPRVTKIESDNIARVMQKKQLSVEYIMAKDEGHGFKKRNNSLSYVVAMERFFAKHLGGRKSPDVSPELEQHLNTLKVDIDKL